MNNQGPGTSLLEDVFRKLPPVANEHLPPLLNPNNGQCVHCKKFVAMSSMPIINTGIVFAQEPLCSECSRTLSEQARIICINCRVVVLWVDPHKDKTGFTFHRRRSYHIKGCPKCQPGLEKSQVLEKLIYCREHNIPTD